MGFNIRGLTINTLLCLYTSISLLPQQGTIVGKASYDLPVVPMEDRRASGTLPPVASNNDDADKEGR